MVGNRTRVKVVKNKVAPPFRQAEFDILYNEGISIEGDLLDLGVDEGIVEKSGSWYSFGETRLGQGRDKTVEFLNANPDVMAIVEKQTRLALGMPVDGERAVPAEVPAAVPVPKKSFPAGKGRGSKTPVGRR